MNLSNLVLCSQQIMRFQFQIWSWWNAHVWLQNHHGSLVQQALAEHTWSHPKSQAIQARPLLAYTKPFKQPDPHWMSGLGLWLWSNVSSYNTSYRTGFHSPYHTAGYNTGWTYVPCTSLCVGSMFPLILFLSASDIGLVISFVGQVQNKWRPQCNATLEHI